MNLINTIVIVMSLLLISYMDVYNYFPFAVISFAFVISQIFLSFDSFSQQMSFRGNMGIHGPTGPMGPVGYQGYQGSIGYAGQDGPMGPTGPSGIGYRGPSGPPVGISVRFDNLQKIILPLKFVGIFFTIERYPINESSGGIEGHMEKDPKQDPLTEFVSFNDIMPRYWNKEYIDGYLSVFINPLSKDGICGIMLNYKLKKLVDGYELTCIDRYEYIIPYEVIKISVTLMIDDGNYYFPNLDNHNKHIKILKFFTLNSWDLVDVTIIHQV
jgi:hypothetical protein